MKNKRHLIILFCLIVALVGSCASPVTPTDTPPPVTPSDTPPPVTPSDTPPPVTPEPTVINVADFAFNEIILTGQRDKIGDPADQDPTGVVDLYNNNHPDAPLGQPIAEIDLSYLAEKGPGETTFPELPTPDKQSVLNPETGNPFFSPDQYIDLVMRLYENPEDISTLLDHVEELNALGNKEAFADPNYFTDPLTSNSGSCGQPYSGGGSPYSGGGSPFADLGLDVPESAFVDQWAFQDMTAIPGGISLLNNPINPITGEEVSDEITDVPSIGIFDTAPWQADGMQTLALPNGSSEITVSDSISRYARSPQTSALATVNNNVKDHGWFAAGLVKAVAPNSRIFLFRVLDDNGCGDLFVLSAAVHEFLDLMSLGLRSGELMNKVVVSLSLGVHVPDGIYHKIDADQNLPPELAALRTAMYEAYRLGALIVAASGNDSAPPTSNSTLDAQRMQLPAYFNNVIGVAANTQDGQRSCFSNQGDVAAPGGNGGVDPVDQSKPCAPRTGNALVAPNPCDPANMDMCAYGVVGPSTVAATTNSANPYGFWSGTSFSTPLVTGLAALAFEKAQGDRGLVYCLIENGARVGDPALGWGTIDIAQSLSLQQCP